MFYLAYEIRVQNFVRLCCVVVEICWKWVEIAPFYSPVRFIWFLFMNMFYLSYDTKFHAAVASGCGKWVEIRLLYIWVMAHFLLLFLMNMFDLACELHVQIFTRLCSVVAKLYQNGFKLQVSFFCFCFCFYSFIYYPNVFYFINRVPLSKTSTTRAGITRDRRRQCQCTKKGGRNRPWWRLSAVEFARICEFHSGKTS